MSKLSDFYNGGDPRYFALLEEMAALHAKKAHDYGDEDSGDFLANIRASEELGIPAWLGAILRGGDKWKRIRTFAKRRSLANESFEDSLIDLAAYCLIAVILHREAQGSFYDKGGPVNDRDSVRESTGSPTGHLVNPS